MMGSPPKGNDGILHCTTSLRTIPQFEASMAKGVGSFHVGLPSEGQRWHPL
jgi:hypothetical protein